MISPSLAAFEERCWLSRQSQADIQASLRDGYLRLGRSPAAEMNRAQLHLVARLEEDARLKEPTYHNRHHICDVVTASALLLQAWDQQDLDDATVDAFMTAALGHDIHHDGRATSDDELERRAAAAVNGIGLDCGISAEIRAFMEDLILATQPRQQTAMRADIGDGAALSQRDSFKLLLGEADVLASLTPGFGWRLAELLREEWQATGFCPASPPDSPEGRRMFLGLYKNLSSAARKLGVDLMIDGQLQQLGESDS